MSLRVLRRSSRASSSAETLGNAMPACVARRSTASGNDSPSVSITKSKIEPCLPEEKSWKKPFWSLTVNEGVFSLLKGESPFHSRPAFLSFTRRPTTSETGRRARSSSRNCGGKRIRPNPSDSRDLASIDPRPATARPPPLVPVIHRGANHYRHAAAHPCERPNFWASRDRARKSGRARMCSLECSSQRSKKHREEYHERVQRMIDHAP